MKSIKKRRWLLFTILLSSFICLFGTAGHGVPFTFWSIELIMFYRISFGDFKEFELSELLVTVFTLTGQLLILIPLYTENLRKINRLGMFAIISLGVAFVLMCITYMDDPGIEFLLTLAPFVILSIIFLATIKREDPYGEEMNSNT